MVFLNGLASVTPPGPFRHNIGLLRSRCGSPDGLTASSVPKLGLPVFNCLHLLASHLAKEFLVWPVYPSSGWQLGYNTFPSLLKHEGIDLSMPFTITGP